MAATPIRQAHALLQQDQDTIHHLLAAPTPTQADAVDAARLLMRYEANPNYGDLRASLHSCLERWGISRDTLMTRVRALWSSGWRPSVEAAAEVGSGADVGGD